MEYRHAPAADHGDLDAVLVSAPGRPTLPVRLTLELFGRALAHVGSGPVTVWDPCCGAGTTLAVLGLRRPTDISGLVGTDIDPSPLDLARRNLALLDDGGLDARADDLDALARRHGKPGYAGAADAARRLSRARSQASDAGIRRSVDEQQAVTHEVGIADATDPDAVRAVVARYRPDVVLADLPHDRQTEWSGDDAATDLVATLGAALAPEAVIAVVGLGRRLPLPPGARALERLRVGHRAAALVRAGDVVAPRVAPHDRRFG